MRTIRGYGTWVGASLFVFGASLGACSSNDAGGTPAPKIPTTPEPGPDGSALDAGPIDGAADGGPTPVEVLTGSSVTLAAYLDAENVWKPLLPATEGKYQFTTAGSTWAVALACASSNGASSTVSLFYRTAATKQLLAPSEGPCTPNTVAITYHKVSGTLSNLPGGTGTLSFGAGNVSYGALITPTAGSAPYSVPSVTAGMQSFSFGSRADGMTTLTRMAFVRNQVVDADKIVNVDFDSADFFVPETRSMTIRGLVAGETALGRVSYVTEPKSDLGIELSIKGTQTIPDSVFGYNAVPAASQVVGDRYTGEYRSIVSGGATDRVLSWQYKTPIVLDLSFPPHVADPTITQVASAPYVRLKARIPAFANAETYLLGAETSVGKSERRSWKVSLDKAYVGGSADVETTWPDLSAIAGWQAVWGIPTGKTSTVSAAATEVSSALSDGTLQRTSIRNTPFTPVMQ